MGITIHYKGKLNSPDLVDCFLVEVEDIAKSMEWKYTIFSESKEDTTPVKGLFIQPHSKSEFLQFMIDRNGNLRNAIMLEHFEGDHENTYLNHIKTQFTPTEIHVAIIKLLKYLKQKFANNLEVWDEGEYWQTGDAQLLQERFDFLNKKMEEFEKLLDSIPVNPNDTTESISDKIEKVFRKLNPNREK